MRPKVVLHNAVSLDGRIDHLTVDLGLFYELAATWGEDATLAGADTILAIQPELEAASEETSRVAEASDPAAAAEDARPLLVVPDSRGRIRSWRLLRRQPYWRDVVALCSRSTPAAHLHELADRGVERIVAGEDHADLRIALEELRERFGVAVVRVDSGGTLNGVLLRARLVDEVSLLVHPALVGGLSPASMFRAPDLRGAGRPIPLRLLAVERVGEHEDLLWLRYEVEPA